MNSLGQVSFLPFGTEILQNLIFFFFEKIGDCGPKFRKYCGTFTQILLLN